MCITSIKWLHCYNTIMKTCVCRLVKFPVPEEPSGETCVVHQSQFIIK